MKETEKRELEKELRKEKNLPIPVEKILEQIEIFKIGIPYIKLYKPCLVGEGIKVISDDKQQEYINLFTDALDKKDIFKFVPASGAATRMFKKQLAVLLDDPEIDEKKLKSSVSKGDEESLATLDFFENLNRFAFYDELKSFSIKNSYDLEELIGNGEVADVVRLVATEEGLNYSNLPKGSIPFHYYPEGSRTAFEEHLIEAMNYVANKDGEVRIHFTISPEHEKDVRQLFNSLVEKHAAQNWIFKIDFSFQSSSTDTISVTSDNKPFRDEDGKIVFRPGGHGALLKNLNDLKADIILIKNIDNVVQEYLSSDTYKYKKILGGYLLSLQEKVFNLLTEWDNLKSDDQSIEEIINFINEEFDINLKERLDSKSSAEKKKYLFEFLNRPVRVCGMVKKEGHPGGGPFFVVDDL
ncbi:MAG: DUF4301 family protein [Ignavibacteriaceae bacterium]